MQSVLDPFPLPTCTSHLVTLVAAAVDPQMCESRTYAHAPRRGGPPYAERELRELPDAAWRVLVQGLRHIESTLPGPAKSLLTLWELGPNASYIFPVDPPIYPQHAQRAASVAAAKLERATGGVRNADRLWFASHMTQPSVPPALAVMRYRSCATAPGSPVALNVGDARDGLFEARAPGDPYADVTVGRLATGISGPPGAELAFVQLDPRPSFTFSKEL